MKNAVELACIWHQDETFLEISVKNISTEYVKSATEDLELANRKGNHTVGKALGNPQPLLDNSDSDNNVADVSGAHKIPSSAKDRDLIIEHLEKSIIFTPLSGRSCPSFSKAKDVLYSIDQTTLVQWMVEHI